MRLLTAGRLILVLAALCVAQSTAFAQDADPATAPTKTDAADSSSPGSIDTGSNGTSSDVDSADEPQPGLMQRFEAGVDEIAGDCVKVLASVMFYEILGRREESVDADGAAIDIESVRKMVQRIEAAGLNPDEVNFTLTLPAGSLTKPAVESLQQQLAKEFTTGRLRTFKVELSDSSDGRATTPVSQLMAARPGIPIVVLWLVLGAVYFTVRMGFINFRGFKHAIMVTAGKFDNPDDEGEVSHFQALTAALSATVGLGNIAGVAIAVATGGPGATFWMIVAGILGMTSKFAECTLGQKYREVRPDGRIMGGAMYYLSNGLKELNLGGLGKTLAVLFAVLCVFASFGGGNAFQVNQSLNAVQETIPWLKDYRWLFGIIMAIAVGIVIIGGIRRIAATAEKIVPFMCAIYVLACLWIVLTNIGQVPAAISKIVTEAFTPKAGYGALLGVLVMGFRRAAFSNEAGVGSAAIAHSAAKTDYPVREGIVALLEPFIDTVVVCTMTALVIVITGAYENPAYAEAIAQNNGAALTSNAMGEQISWFPYVLSVAVLLFAYSTMISWSYYGERCFVYLFGDRASMTYRITFLVFVFLGSVMSATNVLGLSDLMILGMAFPNILGVLLLSGKIKADLDDYWKRYKSGEFEAAETQNKG